jgi:hypothetical protein
LGNLIYTQENHLAVRVSCSHLGTNFLKLA